MVIQVLQPRHQCQCPLSFNISALSSATRWHVHSVQHMCVCTMLGFSLCDFVCDPFGSQSSHSLALSLGLCVCSCETSLLFSRLKNPLMIREIHQPHTHTRHQAKHNGSRRRADTHSIMTWEVSMVASTGSALRLLLVLVHCRCDCSSWISVSFSPFFTLVLIASCMCTTCLGYKTEKEIYNQNIQFHKCCRRTKHTMILSPVPFIMFAQLFFWRKQIYSLLSGVFHLLLVMFDIILLYMCSILQELYLVVQILRQKWRKHTWPVRKISAP